MATFDPSRFKETTRDQWDAAAGAWHHWAAVEGPDGFVGSCELIVAGATR